MKVIIYHGSNGRCMIYGDGYGDVDWYVDGDGEQLLRRWF
jgi:hypothetical protein